MPLIDWKEFRKKWDASRREQEICDIAVPKLIELERMIKEGKCTYWQCMEDIRNFMNLEEKGFLCKKAKRILHRILNKFGQVKGKRVDSDSDSDDEQPDLKF